MWFPPGRWTDWFTGATFTGPSEQTLNVPLDRMPVFVKAGGIVPEQAAMSHVGADPSAPTTLRVYPGRPAASRSTGRRDRQRLRARPGQPHRDHHLVGVGSGTARDRHQRQIGPSRGRYPGQPSVAELLGPDRAPDQPDQVLIDGPGAPSGPARWSYDAASHTLTVPVDGLALSLGALVTELGGRAGHRRRARGGRSDDHAVDAVQRRCRRRPPP